MSFKLGYAVIVLPLVVFACSEEIPTEAGTLPELPLRAEEQSNTGPAEPPDAGKTSGAADTKKETAKKDGGKAPPPEALPLGCAGFTAVEPNDLDSPLPIADDICGTLIAGDVDAFSGNTGAKKTLRFTATGDATLSIKSLGVTKTVDDGGSFEIPSFGPSLPFTVSVVSPTDAPQAYRIVVEE